MKEKRHSLKKHLGLSIILGLLCAALAAGYIHHMGKPVYLSTVTMMGDSASANIIKSNKNVESALDMINADEVNGMVFVRALRRSNLIKVAVISPDSAFARNFVNALAESCQNSLIGNETNEKNQTIADIEAQIAENNELLNGAREILTKNVNVTQLQSRIEVLSPITASLQQQLSLIDLSAANDKANIPSYFLVTAPKEENIKEALDEYKKVIKESVLYSASGDKSRDSYIEESLTTLAKSIVDECFEMTGSNDIAQPLADYLVVEARAQVLEGFVADYNAEITSAQAELDAYDKASKQIALYEPVVKTLMDNLASAKAVKISSPVSIVDYASSNDNRTRVFDIALCVVAFLVGYILTRLCTRASAKKDRGIKNEDQIRAILGDDVASIGWLPFTKKYADCATGYAAERYKLLASNIVLLGGDKRLKVLSFCSAECEEGKSTTTLNVAKNLAAMNKKVIIIEANLRRPDMETYFSLARSQYGLSDVILNDVFKEQAIVRPLEEYPTLNLIGGGKPVVNSSMVLDSPKFKALVKELKAEYDYVFIDCPALSFGSDFMLISRVLDAYILNIRDGVAHAASLEDFNEHRKIIALPLLGYVFYGRTEKNLDKREPDVRKPNSRILAQAPLVHQQIRVVEKEEKEEVKEEK